MNIKILHSGKLEIGANDRSPIQKSEILKNRQVFASISTHYHSRRTQVYKVPV